MAAVVLALQLALPTQEDAVSEARKYFDAGQQAYAAGYYLDAAHAFEKANRLVPNPAITFSIAQSYRLQYFVKPDPQHLRLAIDAYRRYLREVEKGGRRDDALEHVAALEATLARVERDLQQPVVVKQEEQPTRLMITSPTVDARISVDGGEPKEQPVTREVEPGEHEVVVTAPGHFTTKKKVVAVQGELMAHEITLEPKPATVTIDAPDGADVRIDGRLVGVAPLGAVALPAGKHSIVVSDIGRHPFRQELTLARGDVTTVDAALSRTLQRTISYWLLGSGAASFVVTGVVVLVALGSEGRARLLLRKRDVDMVNLTLDERDEYINARDRRNDFIAASTAGLVGGVLLSGIGGLLYFLDRPDLGALGIGKEITPVIAPGTAGLSFSTSF